MVYSERSEGMLMTKDAIIEGLRDLTREERQEVLVAIHELDDEDYQLTDEEKRIVEERLKNMQEHPETTLSYDELKARLRELTAANQERNC